MSTREGAHLEGVEDGGQVLFELHVNNGTDDLGHLPDAASLRHRGSMEARPTCIETR